MQWCASKVAAAMLVARRTAISAAPLLSSRPPLCHWARKLHMVFGAALEPHPAKAKTGGEDAFFADDATSSFGIADGVGGSKRGGADPGIFSRRLLRYCSEHLQQQNATLRGAVTAAATGFAAETIGGSSTFIIGQLENESGAMRWLNLGDSGAVLFRPSRRKFDAGTFLWPRVVMRSVEVHKDAHVY